MDFMRRNSQSSLRPTRAARPFGKRSGEEAAAKAAILHDAHHTAYRAVRYDGSETFQSMQAAEHGAGDAADDVHGDVHGGAEMVGVEVKWIEFSSPLRHAAQFTSFFAPYELL